MSTAAHPAAPSALTSRALHGAVAGIGGGLVFGLLMAIMGMLPMVAAPVGGDSAVVGGIVHLVISAVLGALFALVVPAATLTPLLVAGAGYGVVWWILGALLIMPAVLGMVVFMINQGAWMSLMGHVVYGLVTAAVPGDLHDVLNEHNRDEVHAVVAAFVNAVVATPERVS